MSVLVNLFRRHRSEKQRFMALLRPHIDLMYRMAWRWTGSEADAEDIVQDVLIRLADRVEEMEAVEKLRPWLIRVVYRRYVDVYRSRRASPVSTLSSFREQEEPEGEEGGMELLFRQHPDERDDIHAMELQQTLQTAMETLDDDQRTVILLHDAEGYTAAEVAEMLDESPGTIKSRLHRARKKIKKFIEAGTF